MNLMQSRWVSVLLLVTGISVANADQTIEKSFPVTPGSLLKVATDTGSIQVSTHNKSVIEVKAEIDGFEADDFSVSFLPEGGGLTVTGNKRSTDWGWGSKRVKFSFVVPKTFDLTLDTSGGSINIDDLIGTVKVRTSGGSLSFGKIQGDIEGRTSGGSIEVSGSKGNVRVHTSGGSLTLGDIEGDLHGRTSGGSIRLGTVTGKADVATSGGSIRIENAGGEIKARTSGGSVDVYFTQQPQGDSEISTSGGSITARLDKSIAVNLYARGRKVYSDFPVNGETEAKYKLRGPINGGGPELELQTSSGSVYIRED
ncbi:MAG: DUF4097 family beta strand repeat protein [Gammaproteobacteria bacterium]|nr:DUF4097 family beta strand repeat protein [Gammaproteobacteria bacterium]